MSCSMNKSYLGAQQTLHMNISRYTPARHRALIAMRCASSHRPFRSVADLFYLQEIEMLRPGTVLPSPLTVSRDVNAIYQYGSLKVKEFFEVNSNLEIMTICLI